MFDLLPDSFSKVSLRGALAATFCFSVCVGVLLGMILSAITSRSNWTRFDFASDLILLILYAAMAAPYVSLTLERAHDQQTRQS